MAGKINNETLALNIDINGGEKARKEMNELSRAIQEKKSRPPTKRLPKASKKKTGSWSKVKQNWPLWNGSSR